MYRILPSGIRTQLRIPKAYRGQWRMANLATQNLITSYDSEITRTRGFKAFFLLPALLLRAHTLNERRLLQARQVWGPRFRHFWAGEFDILLQDAIATFTPHFIRTSPNPPSNSSINIPDGIFASSFPRAISLGRAGLLSKAASTLTSAPLAPRNVETFNKLKEYHPRRSTPAQSPRVPPSTLSISDESLAKAIRTASKRTSADLLGSRYEHLQALLPEDGSDDLSCIHFIYQDIARANVPPDIRYILRITSLLGVEKDFGGVRPLAVGNTSRRAITRAIAIDYKGKWRDAVGDLQYAIGTESGLDKLFRGVQSYLESNPIDHSILQLDGKNAFNACDRQVFLDALASQFPELTPFFAIFYDGEAPLWFRLDDGLIHTILSSEGSHQGDPAGGFLFCLGFIIALRRMHDRLPHTLIAAATDDLTIGAPTQDIPHVIEVATEECRAYGIELVPRK